MTRIPAPSVHDEDAFHAYAEFQALLAQEESVIRTAERLLDAGTDPEHLLDEIRRTPISSQFDATNRAADEFIQAWDVADMSANDLSGILNVHLSLHRASLVEREDRLIDACCTKDAVLADDIHTTEREWHGAEAPVNVRWDHEINSIAREDTRKIAYVATEQQVLEQALAEHPDLSSRQRLDIALLTSRARMAGVEAAVRQGQRLRHEWVLGGFAHEETKQYIDGLDAGIPTATEPEVEQARRMSMSA